MNRGYKYIFLLGRPGCGKSEIFRRINDLATSRNIKVTKKDDFPILWSIFQEDERSGRWLRCRKTPDGGYLVTDSGVWDEILKKLSDEILEIKDEYDIVFIEFARTSYIDALKNFADEILDNSIIVYVYASFDVCWQRNLARHKKRIKEGYDDHLVSREEMEKTYLNDDGERLKMLESCIWIDNNTDDEKNLENGVKKILEKLNIV